MKSMLKGSVRTERSRPLEDTERAAHAGYFTIWLGYVNLHCHLAASGTSHDASLDD